jgi:hypothetical protein
MMDVMKKNDSNLRRIFHAFTAGNVLGDKVTKCDLSRRFLYTSVLLVVELQD